MGKSDLPLFCERCGYMLQGLAPQRCSTCSLFTLRCPECGHQQHANSIRPALLRILGRLRGSAYVIGILLAVAACGLVGLIWWVAGMEWASQVIRGRVAGDRDYWGLITGALLSTWSLYAVTARARRRWVPVAIAIGVHTLAFYAGLQTRWLGRQEGPMPLLPAGFVAFVVPWFVIGAISGVGVLRIFYLAFWPGRARLLLNTWVGHARMPKVNLEAIALPPRLPFGEDLPHFCDGCGAPLTPEVVSVCPECTGPHARCSACEHRQPVSLLRPVLRESVTRTFATGLHLLTLLQGGVILAGLFGWLVGGYESSYTYRYINGNYVGPLPLHVTSEEALFATFWAVLFGMILRTMMLRWRSGLVVGIVTGSITAGCFALGMWLRWHRREGGMEPFTMQSIGVVMMIVCGVMAGVLVTWPAWWVFIKAMLPKRLGGPLLHWLTTGSVAELIVVEPEAKGDGLTRPAVSSMIPHGS